MLLSFCIFVFLFICIFVDVWVFCSSDQMVLVMLTLHNTGVRQNIAFIGYTYKSFDAVRARFGDFDASGFIDLDELTGSLDQKKKTKGGKGKREK